MTQEEIQNLSNKLKDGTITPEEKTSLVAALTGGKDAETFDRNALFNFRIKSPWPYIAAAAILLSILAFTIYRYGFIVNIRSCSGSGSSVCVLLVQPNQGVPGTFITIHGDGYSKQDNFVELEGATSTSIGPLASPDTFTLMFEVPQIPSGTYDLTATTGVPGHSKSNSVRFVLQ